MTSRQKDGSKRAAAALLPVASPLAGHRSPPNFVVGKRFSDAFALAVELHANQARKQQGIPYISHLMDASALVMQYGGNEDQAIAALLHDAPEDQGGRATLERIRRDFGDRIAQMVNDCSDSFDGEDDGLPWVRRKQVHMAHFRSAALFDSCMVYAADKISNTRTLIDFLRRSGPAAWKVFSGKPQLKIWYMREMSIIFRQRGASPGMLDELDRCLDTLEEVMAEVGE